MYFLATLHPDVVLDENGEPDVCWLTAPGEKERQVRDFYAQRRDIALSLDHRGTGRFGFVVEPGERIGRVLDLFVGDRGQLLVKMQLDNRHPTYAKIKRGIELHHEKWGVSAGVLTNNRTLEKQLTHVALTREPLFARYDTFLHRNAVLEADLDREIARLYYAPGRGRCYATAELKRKLQGMPAF